jgi:hypothetical protein
MRKVVTAVLVSLALPPFLASLFAEEFPAWSRHADLFVDTSPSGADLDGPVTGFPLLVRLDASSFDFSMALGHGQDLRFTNAAGKVLPYEIDRWDSAGAIAEIWVKTDTLKGQAADQVLRMHWGNAAAPTASDGAAVFTDGSGYVGVWHLGGTGNRPNSAPGGNPAVPKGYGPNASRPGIVGLADSLDGAEPGSYLDIGDGYGNLADGFTFSAWVNPDKYGSSVHFLDLGNGSLASNIALGRYQATQSLSFVTYNGSAASNIVKGDAILAPDRWQHIAVTVSGTTAKLYRNGALVASETLTQPIDGAWRTSNYLGRSNFGSSDYFRGKLDEPRISRSALSKDWIKLAYANQRPDQQVVSFRKVPACAERFSAVGDTLVSEGSILELTGVADCASSWIWIATQGPAPRILDPEVKSLRLLVPRVSRDTSILFQFRAVYGAGVRTWQTAVRIKEAIPDPVFTLPPYLEWDGNRNLVIKPDIANATALAASASPVVAFEWKLPAAAPDTTMLDGALMLKPTAAKSEASPSGVAIPQLKISLCLDNGGAPSCHQVLIGATSPTGFAARRIGTAAQTRKPMFDLMGRMGRMWRIGRAATSPVLPR